MVLPHELGPYLPVPGLGRPASCAQWLDYAGPARSGSGINEGLDPRHQELSLSMHPLALLALEGFVRLTHRPSQDGKYLVVHGRLG